MTKVKTHKFDEPKFRAVVHYICYRCHDPSILGATKLNKVLWKSDTAAFLMWGKPVTGETYKKQQHGPIAKHILATLNALKRSGAIVERTVEYFGYPKKEYVALTKPSITRLTADEISLIDQMIEYVCLEKTATSISEETHDDIWKIAHIGEELPYYAIFAAELGEITESDLRWAESSLVHAR